MNPDPLWSGAFKRADGTYVHVRKDADDYVLTASHADRTPIDQVTLSGARAGQMLATLRSGGGRA